MLKEIGTKKVTNKNEYRREIRSGTETEYKDKTAEKKRKKTILKILYTHSKEVSGEKVAEHELGEDTLSIKPCALHTTPRFLPTY